MIKKQSGFSLIELMIGIFLGIFVVGGVYSFLTTNNSSYLAVQNSSQIHEDARIGMLYLRQQLQTAGFKSEQDIIKLATGEITMLFGEHNVVDSKTSKTYAFGNNDVIHGVDGSGTDIVVIRYRGAPDGSMLNCVGDPINDGAMAVVRYSVDDGNLVCQDTYAAFNDSTEDMSHTAVLMTNVERFEVAYSIENVFYSATEITSTGKQFANVEKVKFGILLKGNNPSRSKNTRTYTILDTEFTPNDNAMYEVFHDSVILVNSERNI